MMNSDADHSAAASGSTHPRRLVPLLCATVAFVIYGALTYKLHPAQDHSFVPERSSLAAAASNVNYGAPLGKVYSGLLTRFLEETSSTRKVLSEATQKQIQPGTLLQNTRDGNGIGYMLVVDLAFRLFGVKTESIITMMLVLLGISTLAFLYRFRDRRVAVVILYLSSMTVMLFTPLEWLPHNIANIPIGGIRYFSLLSILPAFHILFEITDRRGIGGRMDARDYLPMAAQVLVLLIAILVRNSAAPMVAALIAGGALYIWKIRRESVAKQWALRKAYFMVLVGAVFIGALLASFSRGYLAEGRFTETVWHRIFVSLGLYPGFPYGNLREIYDCTKDIPQGLVSGSEDRNGHCIFYVEQAKRGNLPDYSWAAVGIYGRQYDADLRRATFNIARLYPKEVLETFTIVKARYIFWSIGESIKFDFKSIGVGLIGLLVAALANLIAFAVLFRPAVAREGGFAISGAIALFVVFSIVPYILVWAMPHTSADLLCLCFMAVGLALIQIARSLRQVLYPVAATA